MVIINAGRNPGLDVDAFARAYWLEEINQNYFANSEWLPRRPTSLRRIRDLTHAEELLKFSSMI